MVKRLRIVSGNNKKAETDAEGAEEEPAEQTEKTGAAAGDGGADAQKKKRKVRTAKMRRDAKKKREAAELEERHKTVDPETDPQEEPYLQFRAFVKGLPSAVDEQKLRKRFDKHGKVRWIKLIKNSRKQFMGSALVCYQQDKFVEKALTEDGKHFGGKVLSVKRAEMLQRKEPTSEHQVFVAGLPFTTTRQMLKKDFEECGKVLKLRMLMDSSTGDFRGMAFITYGKEAELKEALKYNGTQYGGRKISVQVAGQKEEVKQKGKSKDKDKGKSDQKKKGKASKAAAAEEQEEVAEEKEEDGLEEEAQQKRKSRKEKDNGKRKAAEVEVPPNAEATKQKKKRKKSNTEHEDE